MWIGGGSQDFRTFYVDYYKVGGAIYYGIKPSYGVALNGSYIFKGINVGNAWATGLAFVYKFKLGKKENQ